MCPSPRMIFLDRSHMPLFFFYFPNSYVYSWKQPPAADCSVVPKSDHRARVPRYLFYEEEGHAVLLGKRTLSSHGMPLFQLLAAPGEDLLTNFRPFMSPLGMDLRILSKHTKPTVIGVHQICLDISGGSHTGARIL